MLEVPTLAASASAGVSKSGHLPSMHTAAMGAGGLGDGGLTGGGGLKSVAAWVGQVVTPVTAGSSTPSMPLGW